MSKFCLPFSIVFAQQEATRNYVSRTILQLNTAEYGIRRHTYTTHTTIITGYFGTNEQKHKKIPMQ